MAHSNLLHPEVTTVDRLSTSVTSEEQITLDSTERGNSSASKADEINILSFVMKNLKDQGISSKAADIIVASWRHSTKKQYSVYIKKWIQFCRERQISSISPTLSQVLGFLTGLFDKEYSYSVINIARSALSAFGIVINNVSVGENATIIRLLKSVYNLRPPKPKSAKTWVVSKVLSFLQKLSPAKFISLKELTLKLAMLIALSSACRVQSLHLLSTVNIQKSFKSYAVFFEGLIKQNRPGWSENCLLLFSYPPDRRLCGIFVLNEYLKRTARLRNNCNKLFISYIKPFGPVTKDTISRWLKTLFLLIVFELLPHLKQMLI